MTVVRKESSDSFLLSNGKRAVVLRLKRGAYLESPGGLGKLLCK